jgi:NAD(P) transhydrogenase subunit alpha
VSVLAVIKELRPGERRVAVVPSEVGRIRATGLDVVVESGAGTAAGYTDAAYTEQEGVTVVPDRAAALARAAVTVGVVPPTPDEVDNLVAGSTWISFLPPAAHLDVVGRLRDRRIESFSFDLVPRTTRAQSLDALSSQANLAGYQATLLAATELGRMLPMMMTAAGTVAPARVLVMGAGVAGLQAIATARRLGAAVSAYDVRPEAAEEVRSLGASFVELALAAEKGEGGYAAEQTDEFLARQQELIAGAVAGSDIVITTAAVPGRRAPRLVSAEMVEAMRAGSIIVDLASASGGNCELSVDGQHVDHDGVTIIGASNLPSQVATTASALYARNVANFLALLVHDGELTPDFDDDIVAAMCVTSGGEVRHVPSRDLMQAVSE